VPPGKTELVLYSFFGEPARVPITATAGATIDVGTIRTTAPPPPTEEPSLPIPN
jgi:hypothetical protein